MKIILAVAIVSTVVIGSWYFRAKDEPVIIPEGSLEQDIGHEPQDLVPIVSESIMGRWQSEDDERFIREFRAEGVSVDIYDSATMTTDTWQIYTVDQPIETQYIL